jgi:hypothetical protein
VGYVIWSKCISIHNGVHPAHLRLSALPQAICAPWLQAYFKWMVYQDFPQFLPKPGGAWELTFLLGWRIKVIYWYGTCHKMTCRESTQISSCQKFLFYTVAPCFAKYRRSKNYIVPAALWQMNHTHTVTYLFRQCNIIKEFGRMKIHHQRRFSQNPWKAFTEPNSPALQRTVWEALLQVIQFGASQFMLSNSKNFCIC